METSFPCNAVVTDGVPDRVYSAQDFAAVAAVLVTSGVTETDGLTVSPAEGGGLAVQIAPGAAVIDGYFYRNTAALTLAIAENAAAPRTDAVVLRLDLPQRTITAAVRTGGTPVWGEEIRELPLASVTVGTGASALRAEDIADSRPLASSVLDRLGGEELAARIRTAIDETFSGEDVSALAAAAALVRTDAGAGTALCGDGEYREIAGEWTELTRFTMPGAHTLDTSLYPSKNGLYRVTVQGGGGSGPYARISDGPIGGGGGKSLTAQIYLRAGVSVPLWIGAGGASVSGNSPAAGKKGEASWFLDTSLYMAAGGAAGDYTARYGYQAQSVWFAGTAEGGGPSLLAEGGRSAVMENGSGHAGTLGSGGGRGYGSSPARSSGAGGDGAVIVYGVAP